jgi:hypothetical protein
MGVPFKSEADHLEAISRRGDVVLKLMGGAGQRDEAHLIESQRLANLLGGAQMAIMNRIESSPQNTYLQ